MNDSKKTKVALAAAAALLAGTSVQASTRISPNALETSKMLSQSVESTSVFSRGSHGPRNKPKTPQRPH